MVIAPDGIKIYGNGAPDDAAPVLHIGLYAVPVLDRSGHIDPKQSPTPGISINSGSFYLGSSSDPNSYDSVSLNQQKIIVKHTHWMTSDSTPENPETYASVLDAYGLTLFEGDKPITNMIGYSSIYADVISEQTINLDRDEPGYKKVKADSSGIIVVPHQIVSYDPQHNESRQYISIGYDKTVDPSGQWITSITPYVRHIASCVMTTGHVATMGGQTYTIGQNMLHNTSLTITSDEPQATSALFAVEWKADCGHLGDVRDYVGIKIEHWTKNAADQMVWQTIYDQTHFGSNMWNGVPNIGRQTFRIGQSPGRIQIRITADINDGDTHPINEQRENYVRVSPLADGIPIAIYKEGAVQHDSVPTVDVLVIERAGNAHV